jgi:GDPmannose 4,6-dehydratase
MAKTALICGVSGQDGAWLSKLLLLKGYQVWGTSRDAEGNAFGNLTKLGIHGDIGYLSMAPEDFHSVFVALKRCKPDEIYFLAGQSSVGLSFEQPADTIRSFTLGALNMLEACRLYNGDVRLYNAGSSECFGDTLGMAADENTRFQPRSPYAVAKSSAHWLVDNYREAYNLFACNGILFNHESYLRPNRFVTQKIVSSAVAISNGSPNKLTLGRLDIARDWGAASEYVEAMWLMLQQDKPEDYIIASGVSSTLEEFVNEAFSCVNLNWRDHVVQDKALYRPTDLAVSRANPAKARANLGWRATSNLSVVVGSMVDAVKKS